MSTANITSKKTSSARTIQSVDRALAIIQTLADSKLGLPLSELAISLKLAPQTLQSLLRTLQYHQWVTQPQARGPYQLGPAFNQTHRRWRAQQNHTELANPIVSQLSENTGEYVILAQWTDAGLLPILETQPDRQLAVRRELVVPETLHTMATCKMLLACIDQQRRCEIVNSLPLPKLGPNSITNSNTLLKQLKTIEKIRIAVCIEEAAEGIIGIAVPVHTPANSNPTALGISLPAARFSKIRREQLIIDLQHASNSISQAWA